MKNLIEVQNLCKRYEDFTLEDIHLSVPAGCIVGLIGENGAGKTTTLKAILNIIRPDQGIIRLMGLSPEDQDLFCDVAMELDRNRAKEHGIPCDIVERLGKGDPFCRVVLWKKKKD